MEALKILERPGELTWEYDEEADVLYISVGEPEPALGMDVGEGVILRYDEDRRELVGITLVGLRSRLLEGLSARSEAVVSC